MKIIMQFVVFMLGLVGSFSLVAEPEWEGKGSLLIAS